MSVTAKTIRVTESKASEIWTCQFQILKTTNKTLKRTIHLNLLFYALFCLLIQDESAKYILAWGFCVHRRHPDCLKKVGSMPYCIYLEGFDVHFLTVILLLVLYKLSDDCSLKTMMNICSCPRKRWKESS